MHVTRYIRVWITQGHEHQVAGIARTFQSLFPSPLFLSWMRCSLWTRKEREGSSLDPGPWAVTEMGKLGPRGLGYIYREGSVQTPWGPVLGGIHGADSIVFLDLCDINIPTMANSKLPMCHHWTWSRKGSTRYFSRSCRTSFRDTTEDKASETLDAALPVDVPKATRAQFLCLSYSARPRIQGGILSLLPCPLGRISSSLGTEAWVIASKMSLLFLSPFVHILV